MVLSHFDPFNNRLARDIRNTLSKAFLHAIKDRDAAIFQRCAADYQRQNFEPVYEKYVKERLEKYEKVFSILKKEETQNILQRAAIFWDYELYFEMHELLEPDWMMAKGDRRKALQGLIRAAGMKIHAESSNLKAAVSMGSKALADLAKYGGELAGFTRLEVIELEIRRTLAAARNNLRQV